MLKVLGCFATAHDLRLVGLAAVICALAAFTSVQLLLHARRAGSAHRVAWLAVAAIAGGSGIWATHFIAMLAFSTGLPSGYALGLTAVSLACAIILVGIGFAMAAYGGRIAASVGGAVVGGGIAAMHYTGMAAWEVPGHVTWDMELVAASIAIGGIFGAGALWVAREARTFPRQLLAVLLLIVAICGHHFTAMGAVTVSPDLTVAISASALPASWLAVAVALAGFAILLLAIAALGLDLRDRRRAALEGDRLRSLANAAVEGLVVCAGDTIVSGNESFAQLAGVADDVLPGALLSRFLPSGAAQFALHAVADHSIETSLRREDGEEIPVELIVRPVQYASSAHYAVAVRDLSARRRAEQQIQFLAHHDALTGLANRASFGKRLEQEIRTATAEDRKLAALCLDLDRFKEVNDLFGHSAGDAMLVEVARVVTGVLDDTHMMARLGGDEFAVLAPCDSASAVARLAERIFEAIRARNADATGPLIASSIGIAIFPDDSPDPHLLMSHADTALYRAKGDGRGTYRFYEAKMGAEVRDRRVLEHELRHAAARGEFELVYQPQSQVETGEVVGFEALLRWHHPQRGHVSPSVFIPIAEECGLILQIGEWVLRETCREAASWPRPLTIAVNVSGVQIHSPHFVPLVHEVLFETGIAPSRLEIEITETALIRDPARALLTLRQLKALGIRIAMDDFGTGYSSLSNLRSFPFDKIKIDGSFVRSVHSNEQTAAIVRSVLGLGRGLGLPVLAEGVETEEELRFLQRESCHEAQGYLMGRPAPIGQFSRFTGLPAEPDATKAVA